MQKPRPPFLQRLWHFMCTIPLVPAYTVLAIIFLLSMVALFVPIAVRQQVAAIIAATATAMTPRPTPIPTPAWTLVSPFPTQPVPTPLINGQQQVVAPAAQPSALTQVPVSSPVASATTQPVATQSTVGQGSVWTTTQTITGSGQKETPTFSVSNDWKLLWNCDPGSSVIGSYNVIIMAHDANNANVSKLVINDTCKPGNTQGETEVHDNLGGNIYLDISTEGTYTVIVQELK